MTDTVLLSRIEDLILDVLVRTARWPKRMRYGLTGRLEATCVDLGCEVAAAQTCRGRRRHGHLAQADTLLAQIHLLIRVARDLTYLSAGAHLHVGRQLDEIGRLLGGWIQAERRGRSRRGRCEAPERGTLRVGSAGQG